MSFRDVLQAPAQDALLDGPLAPWDRSRCQEHSAPATGNPRGTVAGAQAIGWATPERADYLRRAWPNNVPWVEIEEVLTSMDGPSVPSLEVIGNFCKKRLKVQRSNWATEERKAYLREMWPTDAPVSEILAALTAMDGPPMLSWNAVQALCTRTLKICRPPSRGLWATAEREAYLRQAWPADVPIGEIKKALSSMDGSPIPNSDGIAAFCNKTLLVKRSITHLTWATEERKAYLRQAWPADVPMAEIVLAMAAMDGRALPPSSDRIQSYASKNLGLHRSSRQALAIRARELRPKVEKPAPPPPKPIEVRGKPGVALPPVSRSWPEIMVIGAEWGREMLSKWDLISLNKSRIAMGYAPLAIKTNGTWRSPSYKSWG